MTVTFQQLNPILRIFDVQKAKDFYVGFLGFVVDWEHQFHEGAPFYLQVSRGGLALHLSEHHGDACPGSAIHVWMTGLDEFHQEVNSKGYRYLKPGIETTFYGARCMSVIDPFRNQIHFNERIQEPDSTSA